MTVAVSLFNAELLPAEEVEVGTDIPGGGDRHPWRRGPTSLEVGTDIPGGGEEGDCTLSPFLTGRMFVRPNILRTLRRTMIRFLIELLVR